MDAETEVVEAGQDLRGALEAAFKEAREPTDDAKVADTSAAEAQAKTDRARDEAGRFAKQEEAAKAAKAEKAEKPADIAKQSDAAVIASDQKAPDAKQEQSKVHAPPNGWSAEAKAKWHLLDPIVQADVAKREQDLGRAAGKMDEERAMGRDFQRLFQPYMPILAAEGTTPQQAVQSLLNTAYILRQGSPQQKREALLTTARQFGIDITPDPANSNSSGAKTDPELLALRQEVAQLKGHFQASAAQMQGASEAQVKQEIDAFAADPANVHYQEVKGEMAALLSGGRAKDLPTAYDMACWARKDIRESILAQQRATDEVKKRESDKARADEARRKAVSVTGAPGSTGAPNGAARDLRQELEAQFAAQRGAV